MSFSCNSTPRSVPSLAWVSPFSFLRVSPSGFPEPVYFSSLLLSLRALFDLEMLRFPKRKIYLLPVSNRKQLLGRQSWRRRAKLCPPTSYPVQYFTKVSLINGSVQPSLLLPFQVRHEALLPHAGQLGRLRRPLPRHAQVRRGALRLQEQGRRLLHQEAPPALVPRVGRRRHLEPEQE